MFDVEGYIKTASEEVEASRRELAKAVALNSALGNSQEWMDDGLNQSFSPTSDSDVYRAAT